MKLSRRALLRSIPIIGAALVAGSLWFLRQTERNQTIGCQTTTEEKISAISSEHQETTIRSETTERGFDFPVTWNGDRPTEVNLTDYRLKVDGDVSNPLQLTIEDLRRMSMVDKTVKIKCVEGWEADVPWEGVPLSYLLDMAGAPRNIDHLTFESVTGYKTDIGGSQLANPDNMIALKAGQAPLTETHGYPARLVAPTRPGVDWVKYVKRITCTKK
jgi:DMSO/TMAO reductase YedYZ molybdopterin-dependent catalytic subunit